MVIVGIIIFILLAFAVVVIIAGSKAEQLNLDGEIKTSKPQESDNVDLERQVEKDTKDAAFISAMLIGKTLTDTTRRLNQWDRHREQREYDKWHWQETVRRDNNILKDPFDTDS